MQHLVDEFGELTLEILRLKKRREALRKRLLEPNAPLRSNQFEVTIRRQTRKLFEKSRLPKEILENPQYYKLSESPIVTVKPLATHAEQDDDFDLIENC